MTLHFGALAAERERDHLSEFFVESPAYRRILGEGPTNEKVVALGNRGSGKTALLTMIAEHTRRRGGVVVELRPEDFAYELLAKTMHTETGGSWQKQGAYAVAWKYLIYVVAIKAVVSAMRGFRTGPSKRLYQYVRDNFGNADFNSFEMLVSYLKRLESVKIGKREAAVKARELQLLYRLEELAPRLDDLNQLRGTDPVVILVDELDLGWDASEDAVAYVAGLFQAATSISVNTPSVRVVMGLRRELYDNIPALFDDAQKVRDTVELIDWSDSRLKHLICKRVAYSLGGCEGMTNDDIWRLVMADSIHGEDSFDYLLGLTWKRPRELIQLCSAIQDAAEERDLALPFDETAVDPAVRVYVGERFDDFCAEHRLKYPGLASVLETFRRRDRTMTRDALELHCVEISVGDRLTSSEARWVRDLNPEQMIDILYKLGVVVPETGDMSVAGSVEEGAPAGPTLPGNATQFRIHRMIATRLDCR